MRLERRDWSNSSRTRAWVAEVSQENLSDLMQTRIEIEGMRCAGRWKKARRLGSEPTERIHRLSRQSKIRPATPDVISAAWWKGMRLSYRAGRGVRRANLADDPHAAV